MDFSDFDIRISDFPKMRWHRGLFPLKIASQSRGDEIPPLLSRQHVGMMRAGFFVAYLPLGGAKNLECSFKRSLTTYNFTEEILCHSRQLIGRPRQTIVDTQPILPVDLLQATTLRNTRSLPMNEYCRHP